MMMPKRIVISFLFFYFYLISVSCAQLTSPKITKLDTVAALTSLKTLGYPADPSLPAKAPRNRQAIIAFQKVEKIERSGKLSKQVSDLIRKAHLPLAKDSANTKHIEVDLDRQVLFVVDSLNTVGQIIPVSTGSGKEFLYPEKGIRTANTPRGKFKVYYKVKGWKKSQLGELYDPMYVVGGIAIHGSQSVPTTPASHGCIRIPLSVSDELFSTTPIGTSVLIYGNNPRPKK
jgi:lipoprotein-anchoring transpeptidase ErfK/SrfK